MTKEETNRLLFEMLNSPGGKAKLATSLASPIIQNLNSTGIARKAFAVDPIPEGALPVYESEEDALVARIENKPW